MKLRSIGIVIEAILLGAPAIFGMVLALPMVFGYGVAAIRAHEYLLGLADCLLVLCIGTAVPLYLRLVECTLAHRQIRLDVWLGLGAIGVICGVIAPIAALGTAGAVLAAILVGPSLFAVSHFAFLQYRLRATSLEVQSGRCSP